MSRIRVYGVRALVALVVVLAVVTVWKWQEVQRLVAVNALFNEEKMAWNFSNMDQLFFHAPIPLGEVDTAVLPQNPRQLTGLDEWIEARRLTALVVLSEGELVYEDYYRDTAPEDRRISWSVAKSFLSALFGILVDEGVIESIDDPVTRYAPELADSAYDGVTIRNALHMGSGIRFNEDYFDFHSDINRMGQALALGGTLDGFTLRRKEREFEPGERFQYVSIDTHVIGMVIRGATGRSVLELMGERVLTPMGVESEPYYITDGAGVAFVLGGLNMMTRDYARFGQMFLQDGYFNGRRIVPADWVAESTVPSSPTAEGAIQYGYQWWIPADASEGEFLARGVYGQFIYINRPAGVVVAANSADPDFREPGAFEQNLAMFRALAEALGRDE